MSAPLEQLRIEVLNLPADERRRLIHELVDSLSAQTDAAIEKAWDDEIALRIREVEEGKVQCVSHDEVMARADAACASNHRTSKTGTGLLGGAIGALNLG